jgi:hypothetical protein
MAFTHATANNVVLPRGKVYFAPFTTGTTTPATYERYLGNTPTASLTGSSTKLDHFSADGPVRIKDKSIITEVNYAGSLEVDNISVENLAAFFLGTSATITDAGATITDETHGAVPADAVVQLGISTTRPSGARLVSTVAVSDGATLKTLGTHYQLDATTGRVLALVSFANMVVDYVIDASDRERVISAGTQVKGALRVIADNSEGTNRDYYMPSVTLAPNGDFVLKGDGTSWLTMKLDLEVLAKDDSTAAIYIDGRAS